MFPNLSNKHPGAWAKWVLSIGVVLTYIVYSTHQKQETSTVITPRSSQATQTTSGTQNNSSGSATPGTSTQTASTTYKDGQYTGQPADAFYGTIQVEAIIQGGKITDVKFLQHPHDAYNSQRINAVAMPYLKQEAIQAQSAQVDGVTGATESSQAFIQSLSSALSQAQ